MRWQNPHAERDVEWTERWLLIHDQASADRELAGFRGRLKRAEEALKKLVERPGTDLDILTWKAQAILYRFGVASFFSVSVKDQVQRTQRYVGRGRPGPNRPTRWVEKRTLRMSFARKSAALEEFERLAGWRIEVTNVPAGRLILPEALHYRAQWHPERGSSRIKGCLLYGAPLSLRDSGHIRGLMVLLWIALWMMALVELGGTSLPAGPPSAGPEQGSIGPGPGISTAGLVQPHAINRHGQAELAAPGNENGFQKDFGIFCGVTEDAAHSLALSWTGGAACPTGRSGGPPDQNVFIMLGGSADFGIFTVKHPFTAENAEAAEKEMGEKGERFSPSFPQG